MPQFAARVVGGFVASVTVGQLDLDIQRALQEGGFAEIEDVRHLLDMTRAVSRTMRKVWGADLPLEAVAAKSARIRDLVLIEDRGRRHLPVAVILPRELRDSAIARIRHAARLVGPLTIEGVSYIAPVWRPFLKALAGKVPVEWRAPVQSTTNWFPGEVAHLDVPKPVVAALSCADPRHEVVESIRTHFETIESEAHVVEPILDYFQRGHLLGDEQDRFSVPERVRDNVGDRLRFAGA